MCKVLSGCDRGRRALVALLEVEALAGLRMHCCDSYHWPKAPREIYDETRTHNTKRGGEVIALVQKIKNMNICMGRMVRLQVITSEKFGPKYATDNKAAVFTSLYKSAGCV